MGKNRLTTNPKDYFSEGSQVSKLEMDQLKQRFPTDKTASNVVKIIGAGFCGLMTLAGIINTISPNPSSSRAENFIFTVVFLVFTFLLVRSVCKSATVKRAVRPSKGMTYGENPTPGNTPVAEAIQSTTFNVAPSRSPQPVVADNQLLELSKRIPQEILQLLWFVNGPFQNYSNVRETADFDFMGFSIRIGQTNTGDEPSAIDIELPISFVPSLPAPLGYYPSYNSLSPEQRTTYLMWLGDITAPIDIGYVFIFYYGLERHLFFGNAEAALATIFVLRNFHNNKSFLCYSADAILIYSLVHNRPEILQDLDVQQLSLDVRLFISGVFHHKLTAPDIIAAHKKFSFENTRYIKAEPHLFQRILIDKLYEGVGTDGVDITLDDFRSATETFTLALANYSLLPSQRFIALPDITTSPRVHNTINKILVETHETVKIELRTLRKQAKEKVQS